MKCRLPPCMHTSSAYERVFPVLYKSLTAKHPKQNSLRKEPKATDKHN